MFPDNLLPSVTLNFWIWSCLFLSSGLGEETDLGRILCKYYRDYIVIYLPLHFICHSLVQILFSSSAYLQNCPFSMSILPVSLDASFKDALKSRVKMVLWAWPPSGLLLGPFPLLQVSGSVCVRLYFHSDYTCLYLCLFSYNFFSLISSFKRPHLSPLRELLIKLIF